MTINQTIPHIFDLASDYGSGEHRMVGTLALSAIDSFNRNKTRLEPPPAKPTRPRSGMRLAVISLIYEFIVSELVRLRMQSGGVNDRWNK